MFVRQVSLSIPFSCKYRSHDRAVDRKHWTINRRIQDQQQSLLLCTNQVSTIAIIISVLFTCVSGDYIPFYNAEVTCCCLKDGGVYYSSFDCHMHSSVIIYGVIITIFSVIIIKLKQQFINSWITLL